MKCTQASLMVLYFEEEEADLWQALQQMEPEKRSYFIKNALRQALLNENKFEPCQAEENSSKLDKNFDESSKELDSELNQEEKEFSLEELFSETPVSNQNTVKAQPSKGYEYMMKYIIGTEEDKKIIKFLQKNLNSMG